MRDCKLVLAIGSDFPGKKLVPGLVPPKRLEELLTLHELPAHARLWRSLASTNGLESSFSVAETNCRRERRSQGSDHRLRWVASALLQSFHPHSRKSFSGMILSLAVPLFNGKADILSRSQPAQINCEPVFSEV